MISLIIQTDQRHLIANCGNVHSQSLDSLLDALAGGNDLESAFEKMVPAKRPANVALIISTIWMVVIPSWKLPPSICRNHNPDWGPGVRRIEGIHGLFPMPLPPNCRQLDL
jgi:hypothetical protein